MKIELDAAVYGYIQRMIARSYIFDWIGMAIMDSLKWC
jgi:hypothetical protein